MKTPSQPAASAAAARSAAVRGSPVVRTMPVCMAVSSRPGVALAPGSRAGRCGTSATANARDVPDARPVRGLLLRVARGGYLRRGPVPRRDPRPHHLDHMMIDEPRHPPPAAAPPSAVGDAGVCVARGRSPGARAAGRPATCSGCRRRRHAHGGSRRFAYAEAIPAPPLELTDQVRPAVHARVAARHGRCSPSSGTRTAPMSARSRSVSSTRSWPRWATGHGPCSPPSTPNATTPPR